MKRIPVALAICLLAASCQTTSYDFISPADVPKVFVPSKGATPADVAVPQCSRAAADLERRLALTGAVTSSGFGMHLFTICMSREGWQLRRAKMS